MAVDFTPIAVAIISTSGAIGASYYAYHASQKTKKKVEALPTDLVKEFSRLNPGVDTVEKVIELLYGEIGRLTENNKILEDKVRILVAEKQTLLDEISSLRDSLDDHQRKLNYLEARIKQSISTDNSV